eukprot:3635727-Prorocentrum_lima.AAC.1
MVVVVVVMMCVRGHFGSSCHLGSIRGLPSPPPGGRPGHGGRFSGGVPSPNLPAGACSRTF